MHQLSKQPLFLIIIVSICLLIMAIYRIQMTDHEKKKSAIAIAVLTSPESIDRLWEVENTWKQQIEEKIDNIKVFYFTGEFNTDSLKVQEKQSVHPIDKSRPLKKPDMKSLIQLQGVEEKHSHFITGKTIHTFKWFYNHIDTLDFDWILKCDDDTYINGEFLVQSLSHYDPTQEIFIGRIIHPISADTKGWISGGAGYIISKRLLYLIGPHLDSCANDAEEEQGEDMVITKCIKKYTGVDPEHWDSLYPYLPNIIGTWRGWDHSKWVFYKWNAISFHNVRGYEMYKLDHLISMREKM